MAGSWVVLSYTRLSMITPGNVDDREPLKQDRFLENIKGELCVINILSENHNKLKSNGL